MKILVRLARGIRKRQPSKVMWALLKGMQLCGDKVHRTRNEYNKKVPGLLSYDMVALWGVRNMKCYQPFRKKGDFLILELGYIGDRWNEWASAGFNSVGGRAEHVIGDSSRRKELWGDGSSILQPWDMEFDRVLVIGQVPRDANIWTCPNIREWYREAVGHYAPNHPVYWRRHPHDRWNPQGYCPELARLDESETLEEAMKGSLIVTWSSNVAADAVLAGRPTVVMNNTSLVYGWASNSFDEWFEFDRLPWLDRMAWCQWRMNELRDGTAWRHLRKRFVENNAPVENE